MIPNMYKMAGELLPSVIHVSARTIAGHALSILVTIPTFMHAVKQAMLCYAPITPQEVMDLGAVAHLSAIKGRVPFYTSLTVSVLLMKFKKFKHGIMKI